jgi:hypothetical protein
MKQGQFAVLCVTLLALLATGTKVQNQDPRIKELEDRIVELDGRFKRIKEEYDNKLDKEIIELKKADFEQSLAIAPVGTILPFYGDPEGLHPYWQLCEGQKLAGEFYKGSPFYNKNLPDLRNKYLRGAENNAALGSEGQVFVPNQLNNITGTAQNSYFHRNRVSGRIGADKIPIGTKWFLAEDHNVHPKLAKRAMLTIPFNSDTSPTDSHGPIGGTGTISGESDIGGGRSQNKRIYHSVFFIIRIR